MPNSIQPPDVSGGSGTDGAAHDSDGDPNLLELNRNDDGRWLNANYDRPDDGWNRDNGFAFVVPQAESFLPRYGGEVLFS